MAIISGFFNAQVDEQGIYDREYDASNFAAYFASFIGNGVFPNPSTGLQAVSGGGMDILVRPGQAWINGYWIANTENATFTLGSASGTLDRIDAIVIQWSASGRAIDIVVKPGTPSLTPLAPLPQRDADLYELIVAYVTIRRGVIQLTQTDIQDTRLNKELCGIVHGVIEQLDTTTLGIQLQTFIDEYKAKYNADYQDFLAFIANLKDLSQQAHLDFLAFLNQLRYASQLNHDQFIAFINGLIQQGQLHFDSFVVWLSDQRDTVLADAEELLDEIRGLLAEDVAIRLLYELQALQDAAPTTVIGSVYHGMYKYPNERLFSVNYALGIGGLGLGPLGGSPLTTVRAEYEHDGFESVQVKVPTKFGGLTRIDYMENNWYTFTPSPGDTSPTSLILMLS